MKLHIYRVVISEKLARDIKITPGDDLERYIWTDIKDLRRRKLTSPSKELFSRLGYLKNSPEPR